MAISMLETEFDAAMMGIYVRAKAEAGYTASIFHRMLSEKREIQTAKQLINDINVSQGYTALWERGRLDLTVEAIVTDNPKWHSLFSEGELSRAHQRLIQYGY
ncbi:MAG: hypothetical protein WBR13_12730 [Allosphingosinicella sp.]